MLAAIVVERTNLQFSKQPARVLQAQDDVEAAVRTRVVVMPKGVESAQLRERWLKAEQTIDLDDKGTVGENGKPPSQRVALFIQDHE